MGGRPCIGQVSDTDLNNGAFKAMASNDKIRFVVVDIEPPTDLEFEAGASFTLDFDVNDEDRHQRRPGQVRRRSSGDERHVC